MKDQKPAIWGMLPPNSRKALKRSLAVIGCLLLLWAGWRGWQALCGNYPVRFLGRVIDQDGRGVPHVLVTFRVMYSDRPVIPTPYGKVERLRHVTAESNAQGDFELTGIWGYYVRIDSVRFEDQRIGLAGVNVTPSDDPGYGVSLDDASRRGRLPDSHQRRVVYRIAALR